MKSKLQGKKVYVGLSGGVDSAVSVALLQREGYEVTGVFIRAWTPPGYPCTWKEDRRSAMRACAVLDIPFKTLDLEKEYKRGVVDYMIEEYKLGRTPNPDVMCNKEIKFDAFLDWALAEGADYVATGHYARINKGSPCEPEEQREPLLMLNEGKDKNKDQSYFLWTLTQDQLKHILFPVGNLLKPEVRKLAEKFGLPQAMRKDSQGLCFLGQVDMKEFLSRYIATERGDVLNEKGEIVGYHNGAVFYTLGERHDFTITKKTPEDEPLYVVSKDIKKNIIVVANRKAQSASKTKYEITNVNWVNNEAPSGEIECSYRYRQEKVDCKIEKLKEEKIRVKFKKLQLISPGQSTVFYRDEICLGGGIIA